MKTAILSLAVIISSSSLLLADFSERRLQNAIASATKSGKLIAFVFYQNYALPNCPKCVISTDANNKALKNAIPRSDVVVIEVNKDDRDLDKLPACVGANGRAPRFVITDSTAAKVIAQASGAPEREKAKEIKAIVEKARSGA